MISSQLQLWLHLQNYSSPRSEPTAPNTNFYALPSQCQWLALQALLRLSHTLQHISTTMHPTATRLATSLPLKRPPPMNLLPPLPLYRRLLRLHRKKLNPEERIFGDTYIKAEFRRHRDIENPLHIVGFLQQWQTYGEMLDRKDGEGDGTEWMKGTEEWAMETLLERMNDQQVGQVWELYNAIQKRNTGGVEEEVQSGGEEVVHLDGKEKR
jgi:hypothetical protein